jgi:uncharacterized protein
MSLLVKLRELTNPVNCVVKNLRISERAIEFDLYSPNSEAKEKSISLLESQFGKKLDEKDLELENPAPDKLKTLRESIRLFNEQRYWECHETMEQVWRKEAAGPEKDVQQGLILAASCLVHYQKSEDEVCLNMVPRTLEKLNHWKESKYYVLDVDLLKQNLQRIQRSRMIKPFEI